MHIYITHTHTPLQSYTLIEHIRVFVIQLIFCLHSTNYNECLEKKYGSLKFSMCSC